MKNLLATLYIISFVLILFSCKDEEKNKDNTNSIKTSIDLEAFINSTYNGMDTAMAIAEIRLDNILSEGGITDNSLIDKLPSDMSMMASMILTPILSSLDLESRAYVIVDEVDWKKGQISKGVGVLKIGDRKAFDEFIQTNGIPKTVDNFQFVDLNSIKIAWKDDIAMIGFSNTDDATTYVQETFKKGLKKSEESFLTGHLKHEDDIHIIIPGKNPILSIYQAHQSKMNSDAKKSMETILRDVEDSHVAITINFENGKLKLQAKNHISDKLLPLVDIIKNEPVKMDKLTSAKTNESIGMLAVNLDMAKFSKNYSTYILDNKLLDASIIGQTKSIDKMLTGELIYSLVGVTDDKPKGVALVSTKNEESLFGIRFLLEMQGIQSSSIKNDLLFSVNKGNYSGNISSDPIGDVFKTNGINGKFDSQKLKELNLHKVLNQILDNVETAEFSGNLLEINGSLNGKNIEENILKTILSQTIDLMFNKNVKKAS